MPPPGRSGSGADKTLAYDRLVLAPGSQLQMPDIPGLAQHAFSVDTYREGEGSISTWPVWDVAPRRRVATRWSSWAPG